MKIKILLFALLFALINSSVSGQLKFPNALSIGQPCPDFNFSPQYPEKTKPFHLNDLRGKVILLDFWATWCQPCIESLQKLDSLQKQFKDSICIITVTNEKSDVVMDFLKKHPNLSYQNLHFITGDTLLRYNYFPSRFFPHEVWINKNGEVAAITGPYEVTTDNINKLLKTNHLQLEVKKDVLEFDFHKPLLIDAFGENVVKDSNIEYCSTIISYVKNAASVMIPGKVVGKIVKVIGANLGIAQLYQMAFSDTLGYFVDIRNPKAYLFRNSGYRLEVSDSTIFDWPGCDYFKWGLIPKFSYELQLPVKDSLILFQRMRNDLNCFFGSKYGITASLKDRIVKCRVLTYDGKTPIATKGGKPILKSDANLNPGYYHVQNKTIKEFLFDLATWHFDDYPEPLLDETGYAGKVDLSFNADLSNIDSVNDAIKILGLSFKEVNRMIPIIVITDRTHNTVFE